MNLIHTENLINEQKKTTMKQKDKQSQDKKLNKKIKFKISKNGLFRPPPMIHNIIDTQQTEINHCTEWQETIKILLIKLLSMPAMSDRDEFEQSIKNSTDMQYCIDQIPIFKLSSFLPYWCCGILTYGSLYVKTKTNKFIKLTGVKDNINKTKTQIQTEQSDQFVFKTIQPEK